MINRFLLILFLFSACSSSKDFISKNTLIEIYPYQEDGKDKAAAMPIFKVDEELVKYHYRFDYLLLNSPKIHQLESSKERTKLFAIYPDTNQLRSAYLKELKSDLKLNNYIQKSLEAIKHPARKKNLKYSVEEMMEIASLFFYCDAVNPDSSITSHVCIGINGINETPFNRDYTLLAAFCYEAIFKDIERDTAIVYESYLNEKDSSIITYKNDFKTLDEYLILVRKDLFKRMRNSAVLKEHLWNYYLINKDNFAFEIIY